MHLYEFSSRKIDIYSYVHNKYEPTVYVYIYSITIVFMAISKTVSGRNDAAVFWPCALAYCCSVSVRLDEYQTVNPWEMLPAENRPGANSTVRPQAVEVY